MIGSSVDKETMQAYRLVKAHAKRHLSTEDVRAGAKGLAPGDPRKVFDTKGLPLINPVREKLKPK